jgi:hypothetical protein
MRRLAHALLAAVIAGDYDAARVALLRLDTALAEAKRTHLDREEDRNGIR